MLRLKVRGVHPSGGEVSSLQLWRERKRAAETLYEKTIFLPQATRHLFLNTFTSATTVFLGYATLKGPSLPHLFHDFFAVYVKATTVAGLVGMAFLWAAERKRDPKARPLYRFFLSLIPSELKEEDPSRALAKALYQGVGWEIPRNAPRSSHPLGAVS